VPATPKLANGFCATPNTQRNPFRGMGLRRAAVNRFAGPHRRCSREQALLPTGLKIDPPPNAKTSRHSDKRG
jgi:hypothetical protein